MDTIFLKSGPHEWQEPIVKGFWQLPPLDRKAYIAHRWPHAEWAGNGASGVWAASHMLQPTRERELTGEQWQALAEEQTKAGDKLYDMLRSIHEALGLEWPPGEEGWKLDDFLQAIEKLKHQTPNTKL